MAKFEVPGSGGQGFARNTQNEQMVWLQTGAEMVLDYVAPKGSGADARKVVGFSPNLAVKETARSSGKITFSIKASATDSFYVQGQDATGRKENLGVFCGDFKNHTAMAIDLLASICRTGNALKVLRVQQLLYNQTENIFNQNSNANLHKYGKMMCGAVAKGRAIELFGDVNVLAYTQPYHEPITAKRITSRSEIRYTADTITKVRNKIKALLATGLPVRVGVLDAPIGMMTHDSHLIAWEGGGHTVLIVGCNSSGTQFMYVDPWYGGSVMKYEGGLVGEIECKSMGIFEAQEHGERRVDGDLSSVPNLLVQSSSTYGTFSYTRGNYMEVVAGPPL